MEYITTTLGNLVHQTAFFSLTWGNVVMIAVACVFLYLAIKKGTDVDQPRNLAKSVTVE